MAMNAGYSSKFVTGNAYEWKWDEKALTKKQPKQT